MSFVYLRSGWPHIYLSSAIAAESSITKGIVGIHLLVFGGMFVVMVALTFILPIVLMGLIFINLLVAYILLRTETRV